MLYVTMCRMLSLVVLVMDCVECDADGDATICLLQCKWSNSLSSAILSGDLRVQSTLACSTSHAKHSGIKLIAIQS